MLEDTLKIEALRKALDVDDLQAVQVVDIMDSFTTRALRQGDIITIVGQPVRPRLLYGNKL